MQISLLFLPFIFQGFAISVDEFYFHYHRGLERWERLSHPVDSFLTMVCYLFLLCTAVTTANIYIYIGLCTLSCLLVTKDEWVHAKSCSAGELWLHSLLFMSHPLCFVASFYLWWTQTALYFIKIQVLVVFLFLVYQILYWLLFLREKKIEAN